MAYFLDQAGGDLTRTVKKAIVHFEWMLCGSPRVCVILRSRCIFSIRSLCECQVEMPFRNSAHSEEILLHEFTVFLCIFSRSH